MHNDRGRASKTAWAGWLFLGGTLLLSACAGGAPPGASASSGGTLASAARGLDFEFYRSNVEPIFIRPRPGFVAGEAPCASCHTFQTTTPLKLEPLQEENGRVYWTEEQSRRNFEIVSRLVVPRDPENSRLLRKPLMVGAGGAAQHTGGKYWETKDDPEWRVMAEWVNRAAPGATPPAPLPEPDFTFFRQCVQPIFVNPVARMEPCAACHAGNGSRDFATPYPEGRTSWTEEESRRSYRALMELIEPGHPEFSRFLHHPLDPAAGGDFMHNGGRRWASKDDPEWQALASWIRGESRGSNCPQALRFPRPS
jgi:hypothetical protein